MNWHQFITNRHLIILMVLYILSMGLKNLCYLSFFSYTSDAPELYQRKLGDLAFLVQNYEFAYNCYHTAKREFNHEHAWFYFAGALVRKASINVDVIVCVG